MSQICRTCFQQAAERNYMELVDDPQSVDIKTKLQFCIPEMDLSLTLKPVVCILCVNLLNSAYTFKKLCVETEHSIKKFMFGLEGVQGTLELKDIYMYKIQNLEVAQMEDTAVVDDLNNLLDDALSVNITSVNTIDIEEHEIVKIEVEEDDDDVIFLEDELLIQKDSGDELQSEDSFKKSESIVDDDNNTVTFVEKKRRGRRSKAMILSSPATEDATKLLHCRYCDFTSTDFEILFSHINCHSDILKSKCKPYFCPLCKLRSKWKVSIINHMKIHNISISGRSFNNDRKAKKAKCDQCSFVTAYTPKWETILANHKCSDFHIK